MNGLKPFKYTCEYMWDHTCFVVFLDGYFLNIKGNKKHLIIKLTGEENFLTWRIVFKTLLECDGVFNVVEGAVKKPAPEIDGAGNRNKQLVDN